MVPLGVRLPNQPGLEETHALASVLRRYREAELAVASEHREEVFGPPLLVVHALTEGVKLLSGEPIRRVEDQAVLAVQVELPSFQIHLSGRLGESYS